MPQRPVLAGLTRRSVPFSAGGAPRVSSATIWWAPRSGGVEVAGPSVEQTRPCSGAHVTAGVLWLVTLLAIDYRRGLGPKDAINVDLAALYWHFVDVVWIAIFTLVYLIE